MAPHGRPLKVLLKGPYSIYSGYGTDGFGLLDALDRWGCDVYPQPTWVDVPIPPRLLPLFGKTLLGPFDLTINHWDPSHLHITREARQMCRVAVGWTMWEFDGGPGPLPCARHRKSGADLEELGECPDCVPGPVSGLHPHCERIEDTHDEHGESQQDGLANRLRWFDMVLGYDPVSLAALEPFIPGPVHRGVLQGGYDSREWKHAERDWHGERFQFAMHGALNNRKQPWVAIEAFQKLKFEKKDEFAGARLALHTNTPGSLFPELNTPFEQFGIKVYVDTFDAPTMREFYAAAHCLLSPSRGEGKNLPALEFMTTGGAVAATNFGGHTQWLSGDWAYPLDYTMQATFGDAPWGAHDARVSVDHLADVMWHIYTHREEARQKGLKAEKIIPQMCDWDVVLEKLFQRIRDEVTGPGPQVYDAAMACRRDREEEQPRRLVL